jgi:polyisoprenoid-binding protein YceI
MRPINMEPSVPLAHLERHALRKPKMSILPSCGALLLAVAILALPLATRADGALFVLDRAESHVEIAVKATLGSFVAHLEDFNVAITLDPECGLVETAAFHANLSAVKTGRADRDHNMSKWLQTNELPQVVFELGEVDRGPNGALTARGQLQLHGQRHEIRFPVTVFANRGLAVIDGTATLDTQDFGLPIIRFLVLTVDPVVQVHFHLQGSLPRQRQMFPAGDDN